MRLRPTSRGHAALILVLGAALPRLAAAAAASPTVEGPITGPGTAFVAATSFDLAQVGYEQAEYFVSGTASAYTNTAPLGADGLWSVAPGATADYKTRLIVFRPSDPKRFSGTVVVEWLNVSGGVDAGPDWTAGHVQLIREGVAWVGVSAQRVGVEGGPSLVGLATMPLKTIDPARYGSLHHPGDSFSYDMFSQAGQAVRTPSGPNPLGQLMPKRVIAIGESQSAFRLVNYVNAVHPLVHVYDGYLIHSRSGFGIVGLSEAPEPAIPVPGATHIRGDIDVPVLTFQTETDLSFLQYFVARQDDGPNFRLWEVAGTAHADTYTVSVGPTDLGDSPDAANLVITTAPTPGIIECDVPINSGPSTTC
jgi:hypothetical protein